MFTKILLAHDGSAYSVAALGQAADLARACGAELILLGVVPTGGFMALAEGAGGIDIWGMERKTLDTALKAAVAEIGASGVTVSAAICEGDPGVEITGHACRIGADLIVVGHTGKGAVARWFEGSVGKQLLSNLACSLLIVRSDKG